MWFSSALFVVVFALTCIGVYPELHEEIVVEASAKASPLNVGPGSEPGESRHVKSVATDAVSELETPSPHVESSTESEDSRHIGPDTVQERNAEIPPEDVETGTKPGDSSYVSVATDAGLDSTTETAPPNLETVPGDSSYIASEAVSTVSEPTTETASNVIESDDSTYIGLETTNTVSEPTTETESPDAETTEPGDYIYMRSVTADAVSEPTTEAAQPIMETPTGSASSSHIKHYPFPDLPEPTPDICPYGIKCGFQIYDQKTRLPSYPFIKYCNCPGGAFCVKVGENRRQSFFYYRCKESLLPGDEVMPSEAQYKLSKSLLEILKVVTLDDGPGDQYISSEREANSASDESDADDSRDIFSAIMDKLFGESSKDEL